jgi:hypothetical protein
MGEVYFGYAVVGLLAGALAGNAANRVVSRGLDYAVSGAGRAYENLRGGDPTDPENKYVIDQLEKMVRGHFAEMCIGTHSTSCRILTRNYVQLKVLWKALRVRIQH